MPGSGRDNPPPPTDGATARPARRAAVIGAGVVGKATATILLDAGFQVYGEDTNPQAFEDFPGPGIGEAPRPLRWDLIIISVPTPTRGGTLDATAVREASVRAAEIAAESEVAPLIAVRSTLMPGMMAAVVAAAFESPPAPIAGLCYWPSFARERSATADERQPRTLVFGAADERAVREVLGTWLARVACPVHFTSWESAELAKAGANAFNALKISYFNAVSDWAAGFGGEGQVVADMVLAAAEGAWNPPYGTRVGPPYGGACLPKDLEALTGWVRDSGLPHAQLLEAVRSVNQSPLRTPPRDER